MPYDDDYGRHGHVVIDANQTSATGDFYVLFAVTDFVASAITMPTNSGSGTLATVTINAGIAVPIPFTSITRTSGVAIAYKRKSS